MIYCERIRKQEVENKGPRVEVISVKAEKGEILLQEADSILLPGSEVSSFQVITSLFTSSPILEGGNLHLKGTKGTS